MAFFYCIWFSRNSWFPQAVLKPSSIQCSWALLHNYWVRISIRWLTMTWATSQTAVSWNYQITKNLYSLCCCFGHTNSTVLDPGLATSDASHFAFCIWVGNIHGVNGPCSLGGFMRCHPFSLWEEDERSWQVLSSKWNPLSVLCVGCMVFREWCHLPTYATLLKPS